MSLKYLLIASAVLIGVCHGDVSEINDQKIDLLVPFNDLLPPLLDESTISPTTSSTTSTSTTSTTTTVAPPPPTAAITKPTKKILLKPQHVAKVAPPPQAVLKPQYARIASPAIHPTQASIGGRLYLSILKLLPHEHPAATACAPCPTLTPFPRHIKK
ncbi:GL12446 [Drosophila persimilis]|uniref:GL12446 n=1 Tax=Drosophila persimilis TaxID=7234 RepID=B4GMT1_DROPE|nr:GL12446 [Drosophila persimilis]